MSLVYSLLSFLSGIAIAFQVGINGQLRSKLDSPIFSSFISFAVGTLALGLIFVYTLAKGSYSCSSDLFKTIPWWMFAGGLFGAFYIFTSIFATPKIGYANMFSLVICGQVILAVIFDHFGFLGNEVHLLTIQRVIGVLFLLIGVFMIQKF